MFVPAPSLNIIDKENDISQDEEIHQEESKCNSLEEGDEQISEAEIQEKDSSLMETNIGNDIIEPTSGSPEQSLSHNEEHIKQEEIDHKSVISDNVIDNNDLHISSPEQTSIKSTESNESITSHQTDNNVESSTTEKEKQEPVPTSTPPIIRNKEYLQEELRWLEEEEVRIETALLRRIEVRLHS